MKKLNTPRSKFIVRNQSQKDVRVVGGASVGKSSTADLFKIINNLSESVLIDELREPSGTIYRELFITRNLQLLDFELVSFANSNLDQLGLGAAGQVLSVGSNGLIWIDLPKPSAVQSSSIVITKAPLRNQDGVLGLPQANSNTNGYLSKEDWARFGRQADRVRLWEFCDFEPTEEKTLCINRFSNGGQIGFDPSAIVSASAIVVDLETGGAAKSALTIKTLLKPRTIRVERHLGQQVVLAAPPPRPFRLWFLVDAGPEVDLTNYLTIYIW